MMLKRIERWIILIALLSAPFILAAQTVQEREAQAASFLVQGDDAYAKGDYQKAVEEYLLVVQTSGNKMNLSRAHMGLSLCYFYLNDTENAKKYILKVLENDPQKEVSPLFHPQSYVDLFNEVKKENEGRLGLGVVAAPAEAAPETQEKPGAGQEQQVIPEGLMEEKGGRFEIDVHFSAWSIDPAKSAFEGTLTKKIANEIRDQVTDQLNAVYGGKLSPSSYEHSLSLDSQGSNYGFEVRYYPLGRRGSMSIGLSLEKTRIKLMMKGPVTQRYADGSAATVEGDSVIEMNPLTTNLSFRWDFVPSWRVTPYIVLGLGIGPLEGTASYVYTGTYRRGSAQSNISGDKTKTFDELREEGEIELDRFILLHTALGVKGNVYKGLLLKAEVGFWDGLVLRGGLAYRF
jgi:hypothetical protein